MFDDDAMRCRGTANHSCGVTPGPAGRFILGCRFNTLWVLCACCAHEYRMNIQIALNTGDTELTYLQAWVHSMMD